MLRLAEVFLRRLDLGEHRRLLQRAEQRMERLARHEVDRAILHLHEHVRPELSVELRELDVRALGAIGIDVLVVDERAPDDVAAARGDGVGEAVRAFGMIAAVVFRAGLPFGVGFDEEAAEVGDAACRSRRPCAFHQATTPGSSGSAVLRPPSRIGAAKFAERIHAERRTDATASASAATLSRYSGVSIERVRVDAVDDRRVDADRRVRARVVGVARVERSRQLVPLPQRAAGVAALDRAVHVVPVVQHAQLHLRALGDVERVDRLAGLHQPQQVERAVERADLAARGDHDRRLTGDARRSNDEPFASERGQLAVPLERADRRRTAPACRRGARRARFPSRRAAPRPASTSAPGEARRGSRPSSATCRRR